MEATKKVSKAIGLVSLAALLATGEVAFAVIALVMGVAALIIEIKNWRK